MEFKGFIVVGEAEVLLGNVEDALPDVREVIVEFAAWVVKLLLFEVDDPLTDVLEAFVVELATFVGEWLVPEKVLVVEELLDEVDELLIVELELWVDNGLEPNDSMSKIAKASKRVHTAKSWGRICSWLRSGWRHGCGFVGCSCR